MFEFSRLEIAASQYGPLRKSRYTRRQTMGALARCWRCEKPFRPFDDERVCSSECSRELRLAHRRKGRICLTCATPIHPRKRADALFCSPRCYQRALRVVAKRREFESLRELVRDDMREIREGWRWAEKSNPSGYHGTPVGHQLTEEMLRIEALFDRRERSNCEHCGRRTTMRKGQKYCSTRCRVAAHRDAARVRA